MLLLTEEYYDGLCCRHFTLSLCRGYFITTELLELYFMILFLFFAVRIDLPVNDLILVCRAVEFNL